MSLNDWLMVATLVAAVAVRWLPVAGLAATYCAQSAIISRDKSVLEILKVLGTISSMILIGVMALRWLRKTRLKGDEEDPLECRGDSGADCATGGDVSSKD